MIACESVSSHPDSFCFFWGSRRVDRLYGFSAASAADGCDSFDPYLQT